MIEELTRYSGSVLGLAVGDALGHPTEFMSMSGIRARYGEAGVADLEPAGRHARGTFTDDTQMSICVLRALARTGGTDLDATMDLLGEEFVAWSRARVNDRAPGGTCMRGCRSLEEGLPWRLAGVEGSKGCGAAMRAAPVGLFFAQDLDQLLLFSAAQSSLTHRHPTGIASSVAAAAAVAHVLRAGTLDGILEFTRGIVERLDTKLLVEVGCTTALAESVGNTEMLAALDHTRDALSEETDDVCALLGGAWVGEEAVATALWCAMKAGSDFRRSVLRGANSSGDSDSIACIAGSITGALVGESGVPETWRRDVEKTEMLSSLSRALHAAKHGIMAEKLGRALDPYSAEHNEV